MKKENKKCKVCGRGTGYGLDICNNSCCLFHCPKCGKKLLKIDKYTYNCSCSPEVRIAIVEND